MMQMVHEIKGNMEQDYMTGRPKRFIAEFDIPKDSIVGYVGNGRDGIVGRRIAAEDIKKGDKVKYNNNGELVKAE